MNGLIKESRTFNSLQRGRKRGTALSIFSKLLRTWLLTCLILLQVYFLNVEAGHASFPISSVDRVGTLAYNSFRWRSIRLFNSYPCIYMWRTFLTCQDSITAWMVEIVDGGHRVMPWLPIRCR